MRAQSLSFKSIYKTSFFLLLIGVMLSSLGINKVPTVRAQDAPMETPTLTQSINMVSPYVQSQLIVKFKPEVAVNQELVNTNSIEVNDLMTRVKVTSIEPMINWPNGEKPTDFPEIDSYYVLGLSHQSDILSAQQALMQSEDIEFAFPNYVLQISDIGNGFSNGNNPTTIISSTLSQDPNDTYYSNQWTLHDNHLRFRSAWNITTGSSDIIVAVLDTGLDTNHPDIGGKNSGTGFNFVNNNNDITDAIGHGTLVSGLIAAYSNNNSGIAGICWNCKIMPVKVCSYVIIKYNVKCNTIDVINGMLWAANHGARIINMSLIGGVQDVIDAGHTNPATYIQPFFDYVYNKHVVVVAGAGNNNENLVIPSDSNPGSIFFPAAFNHVIAVGAVTRNDQRCNFDIAVCGWDQVYMTASGWGERLDVVAPGSTDYPSTDIVGASPYSNGDYWMNMGGTSGAAPHVAGLAALILSVNPSLNPDEVENLIEQNAVDLGVSGKDVSFGWGRIDAYAAIQAAQPPTNNDTTPPTGSWTSPSNGSTINASTVTLSVNASDNAGGSGVKEVRFSAKWNNQWSGIGNDSSAPYSVDWNLCNSGVPNGVVDLGFEVWDNANNKWVYSEHSTNYHINKNYNCEGPPITVTPPTPVVDNGIEVCEFTNYGTPCKTYTYSSDGTCTNLANEGWDNKIESLRFKGTYIGGYSIILFDDNSCGTYIARYGSDANTLGLLNNLTGSFRIEDPPTDDGDYPPAGFTRCTDEFSHCDFRGTAEVVYGAQRSWTSPRSFTDGVDCSNSVFGDPIVGPRKKCYIKMAELPGKWCAKEGDACSFGSNKIATVYYGLYGLYIPKHDVVSSTSCDTGTFGGDPYPGLLKACYYVITGPLPPPQFNKITPAIGSNDQLLNVTLSWSNSSGVNSYQYCYDTSNNSSCDTTWNDVGTATSVAPPGLNLGTTYYWQVRATNSGGSTYADGDTWWSFSTGSDLGASVSTTVNVPSVNPGDTALVSVSLLNVPPNAYASAEFTCAFNAALVEANNTVFAGLFGADAVTVVTTPQNGTFIVAIAGSKGNRATTSGVVFTFHVKGLQAGQTAIECTARLSKGDNVLTPLPSSGAILEVLSSSTPPGLLNGQVIASKPVTINVYKADNTLIASMLANVDGTFTRTISSGNYSVIATASGFLSAQGPVTITGGNTATMPTIHLWAGDIDNNNVIDQFDAITIGMSYNTSLPSAADLNDDGNIDVLDLELLAANYRGTGPIAWQ